MLKSVLICTNAREQGEKSIDSSHVRASRIIESCCEALSRMYVCMHIQRNSITLHKSHYINRVLLGARIARFYRLCRSRRKISVFSRFNFVLHYVRIMKIKSHDNPGMISQCDYIILLFVIFY